MTNRFPTRDLGEVSELHDSLHQTPQYADEGYPMIRVTDIRRGFVETTGAVRVDQETYLQFSRKHKPHVGDILFSRVGSYGNSSYVIRNEEFCLGQNTVCISPEQSRIEPYFLYCTLNSDNLRHQIESRVGGASQGTISLKSIRKLQVPTPPLPVQQRIAGILSAYDDLIGNNQRRIKILEEMARSLYREWFVNFRFPGHEKVPLVDSPLGDIPHGWKVANLDAVRAEQSYAINGGPFGSKLGTKDYIAEGVPVIRGSNLRESGRFDRSEFVFVSEQKAEELHANLARPGDIVVTQRGTLGQIGMIPSGIGYNSFVISQSQMKITLNPKKVNREYVFFFLRSEEVNRRIKNLASSSGVPHINLAVLREFPIVLPPFDLQTKFGEFALSVEATIESLTRQIENLRRTRELLLPRLLSGELLLNCRKYG